MSETFSERVVAEKKDSSAGGNAGRDAPMENHCEKMNHELADGDHLHAAK